MTGNESVILAYAIGLLVICGYGVFLAVSAAAIRRREGPHS